MIGPLPTVPGGFNRVLVAIDKFTKWINVSRSPTQRPIGYPTSWMNLYIATDYPIASSQTWGPTSTTTSSGSTARTVGSTSGMSQSLIHGPTDKLSVLMGWYSTPSRSDYMMLLIQKGASGSRNYPMHSGGFVLNLPSQQGSHHTS
jgi:hypothetical protein